MCDNILLYNLSSHIIIIIIHWLQGSNDFILLLASCLLSFLLNTRNVAIIAQLSTVI